MEKTEKERRIQELLDEKQRIHGQWADERNSLDHRVRLLEQDLRQLVTQYSLPFTGSYVNGAIASNGTLQGNYAYSPSNLIFYGPTGEYFINPVAAMNASAAPRGSNSDLSISVKAAVLHQSNITRMEELKRKMAGRRGSNSSWISSSGGNKSIKHLTE